MMYQMTYHLRSQMKMKMYHINIKIRKALYPHPPINIYIYL